MSKLLSEAQRNPSEDDSSGSDAGSEVSLEPETDRFGFLLTNGSTAGSVGPSPELVRQREAKWINIIGQWDHILSRKSSKVKLQCQKGIPASLRAKCWPLLCGAIDRMKQNKNIYETLDSQPGLQNWVDIIERDLDRQFPFHEMFLSKDGHGQRGLFRVLKAYTQFQPEEGYCQAQGPVAAVLLMNMPAEEAFWCLVQVSEQYLPGYYSPLLEGVLFDAALLNWVLKKTCPAAHKHLQNHGVEPLMFATDWLMCLFTRHLPFNTLLRVWDLFFCYGVRVLLQVAVVLVRRVLGRTEQRKQCQGQMETLERLRGVKEEVQDEDDAFITEVCSVPLSKRDLEKRMEKEFEKWRKDKPSSTFDPRGRCHGYRMAWARAQQKKEEWERKQREKGNLSIPLVRSASTLSLSPSLLHKKWKKGGKVNTGDSERSNKVVRHLSMGAKEDWRSWAELDFKKKQDIQEEDVPEGHKTKKESKLVEEKEPEEHLETEDKVVIVIVEEQTEKLEENISTEEKNKTPSEQREEDSVTNQTDENDFQSAQVSSDCEQKEKPNDTNQSQPMEEQNHTDNDQDSELTDINGGAENLEEINEHTSAVEDNDTEIQRDTTGTNTEEELQENSRENLIKPADMKPQEGAETENTAEVQVDRVTEVSDTERETNLDTDQDPKADTQQEQEQVITGTKEDTSKEKYQSSESLRETERVESHAQTETDVPARDEMRIARTQTDPEQHTDTGTKTEEETTLPDKDANLVADTQTEDEEAADQLIINTTNEPVQETGKIVVSEPTETHREDGSCDQTNEETDEPVRPAEEAKEDTSTQEVLNDLPEPDDKISAPTLETQAPEHPASQVATGAVEDVENSEKVPENTAREDIITSTNPKDESVIDSSTHIQNNEFQSTKPEHSSQEQTSGRRSSRSSGDFRVRKSSSSLGSKLTRRLSEDLFISPEKSSQFTPNHPEEPPKEVNTVQPEQRDVVSTQQEQQPDSSKRFGLFHKMKDQPQKDKKKPKMQVPKILIQDFSDVTGAEKPTDEGVEEKISSRERRRRRREKERKKKEEEKLKKKKEKELEKERRKPQTRGKSFQEQKKKAGDDVTHPAKTGSQTLRFSASYAESYF